MNLCEDPRQVLVVRRIRLIEEWLDAFWQRRRRLLALAYARGMRAEMLMLVDRETESIFDQPVHIAPMG